jgi:Fe-S cluster assembly ATP-binding protein
MGRNGSGKSTLSSVIMGHPSYEVVSGEIRYLGEEISELAPDERARRGIFLAFQYPMAIPGVTVANFLRQSMKAVHGDSMSATEFRKLLKAEMAQLGVDPSFATRYVNDGFSGGEKKRLEILHMSLLKPRLAILDETDSGLDIDALKSVSEGINRTIGADSSNSETSVLIVTHYERILKFVKPHFVHILMDGRIVRSGGPELALEVDTKGFEWIAESLVASGAKS